MLKQTPPEKGEKTNLASDEKAKIQESDLERPIFLPTTFALDQAQEQYESMTLKQEEDKTVLSLKEILSSQSVISRDKIYKSEQNSDSKVE